MTAASPIEASIDLDADGIRHGHLRLPHSHDGSAWGHVMIPITVARNGDGPTALLTGGSHGDEYEGPLALMELANALEPAHGRPCDHLAGDEPSGVRGRPAHIAD